MLKEPGREFSRREAWLFLFSNLANGIEKNGLRRGEFEASIRYLAGRWSWHVSKVHRFLQNLEREGMIRKIQQGSESTPDRFIVCKYDTYQDRNANRNTQRNAKRNTKPTENKELAGSTETPTETPNGTLTETIQNKDKPKSKTKGKERGTPAPADFTVTDSMKVWASVHAPLLDVDFETHQFLDKHTAKGHLFADWYAAWRNWFRMGQSWAEERRAKEAGEPSKPPDTTWVLETGRTHGKPRGRSVSQKPDSGIVPEVQTRRGTS